ncbi:hypothetical protein Q8A67_015484 [Cirrhinus molitorella]|uniref:Uncharacterized protein n=1 Tax=Cirrhinus molitorella TaxID=172907 RepID=A0AA88TLS0_9TELE|nr:hypothetical protein Q8A67_015484 [Cirrhinus molitorella]
MPEPGLQAKKGGPLPLFLTLQLRAATKILSFTVIFQSACRSLALSAAVLPADIVCSPAWLVDTRKSSLSRKTPRSRQRPRNPKATTRRPRRKRHWCSHVASAGHKCQIPRPSSSILRASTPRALSPQSWRAWRHERPRHQRHESHGSKTDDV